MDNRQIENAIEAILFANGDAVSIYRLCEVLEMEKKSVCAVLKNMLISYNQRETGLKLLELDESYQLCTREQYSEFVKKALDKRRNTPLSQAALEVLAITAYNQPVTKAYIEQIRGVDCSSIVNTLVEKDLLEECGRLDAPGRPLLYGTTLNFLRVFNLSSLSQLPQKDAVEHPEENKEELGLQMTTDDIIDNNI